MQLTGPAFWFRVSCRQCSRPDNLGDMTMKVLCISKWAKAPSPEEADASLPK